MQNNHIDPKTSLNYITITSRITPKKTSMARLEDLLPETSLRGILPDSLVTVVSVRWCGSDAVELTYRNPQGKVADELLYRGDESRIEITEKGRPWSLDGNGRLFRLVSEAQRVRLAHLFDPVLAVHTSRVEPLPHQITAVYREMLPKQPLRFLLADDPGAGKTIMAGLLVRELIARGDLKRCLVVCPGVLAEQWQDELRRRFHLRFEIMTGDKLEAAGAGNWFRENNLVIARLDKLSRDENTQAKLDVPDAHWDLVICDEAHKMSASVFGGEVKYTKRYLLGRRLSALTRHFLLMSATPHNGKEEDFRLFMALLDGDRFEGRPRDTAAAGADDASDLMRRMVKENLLKFDATPLFPPRVATTVSYRLSDGEAELYHAVTGYVRDEFNRADKLQDNKRAGTVGFALTILQRRLASSPAAIHESLRRRKGRLESRLRELELLRRGGEVRTLNRDAPACDEEDLEDFEDAPDNEAEETEEKILDRATAAETIDELKAEIRTLGGLERLAYQVRRGGRDRKWRELAKLLQTRIFGRAAVAEQHDSDSENDGDGEDIVPRAPGGRAPAVSPHQKLVVFTEHRDTLVYLRGRVETLLGGADAVAAIYGGMSREERRRTQNAFLHDPKVKVLIATDAAGEGINLQRAHLMVNYDLPWNPNRLEQRFGRIHRIGQTETCFLWNLVAGETREGDVYCRLLEKLEKAREALGGQVFNVLGEVVFDGASLRDLLIDAVRRGEERETRTRIKKAVEGAFDPARLRAMLGERALAPQTMGIEGVCRVREDMERAEARRLQPHYIESFFLEAFRELGGAIHRRERRRYEVTSVPAAVRERDRAIGAGESVLPRYERVVFEKELIAGPPMAAFVCPGHPLLDATLDLILERHRDLLRRGAVLVDERDAGEAPRMLFYLEHAIQDGVLTRAGERREVSRRMLHVEMDADGAVRHLHYAPYLDYRPLKEGAEPSASEILARPECAWLGGDFESRAREYAVSRVVPEHLGEVEERRRALIDRTEAAVKKRLTSEIAHWDHRAEELKLRERAGAEDMRLSSAEARRRANEMEARLAKRMRELSLERRLSALPPVVLGGMLVVPAGFLAKMGATKTADAAGEAAAKTAPSDTRIAAARAREIVMEVERALGNTPRDREDEKLGYDIESAVPGAGRLRFIEVKGRAAGAATVTVTRNEVLYSLNKPDDFILAVVEFDGDLAGDGHRVWYVRGPFRREPEFGVTSVNYDLRRLLKGAERVR